MRIAVAGENAELIEGEIEIGPASNGVIRLKMDNGKTLIRHTDDVLPLDDEADDRMKNGYVRAKR